MDTKWRRWHQTKWAPKVFLEYLVSCQKGLSTAAGLGSVTWKQGCFPTVLLASVRSQGCLMPVQVSTWLPPSRQGPGHLLTSQPEAAEDTGGQHCWKLSLGVTSETLTALEVSSCNGFTPLSFRNQSFWICLPWKCTYTHPHRFLRLISVLKKMPCLTSIRINGVNSRTACAGKEKHPGTFSSWQICNLAEKTGDIPIIFWPSSQKKKKKKGETKPTPFQLDERKGTEIYTVYIFQTL